MDFDFDEWKRLFESDPEEAERRRKEVIEAAIARATPRQQENLRRLQWCIDTVWEYYKPSPINGCVAMNQMLMDRVYGVGGLVCLLHGASRLLQEGIAVSDAGTGAP